MSHHDVVRTYAGARRLGAISMAATLAVMLAALSTVAQAASTETPGETFPVSVTAAGEYANGGGTGEFTPVSISADGRYVAFESSATNLGAQGPDGASEGFVKDLDSGAVELVSRADGAGGEPAGEPGIADLRLSADGRYVIFTSAATNLGSVLPGEEPSERHVYRRDLQTGQTILVDRVSGAGGATFSRGAYAQSISADGRHVLFAASVENLEDPAGDHSETANPVLYVRDTQAATTTAVSRASGAAGAIADEPSEYGSISADGRYVSFPSRATNLVPGVDDGVWNQVYLRDLQSDVTSLVSQNALAEAGDRGSSYSVMVGDEGCGVQFNSIAFNLLQPSPLEVSGEQVYIADRCSGAPAMTLVSRDDKEIAGYAYSLAGGSGDGRRILFTAEFLGAPCCHLYLRDLDAEQTSQLDRASGLGATANAEVEQAAISANGCRAVFATMATNLSAAAPPPAPGGGNSFQVYARQLTPCAEPGARPAGEAAPGRGNTPAGAGGGGAPTQLRLAALSRRKLVLNLSGAGTVAVRIRRFAEEPRRHWKFLRAIVASTAAGGQLEIPLPDFPAGRYRLNTRVRGSEAPGTVRILEIGGPS